MFGAVFKGISAGVGHRRRVIDGSGSNGEETPGTVRMGLDARPVPQPGCPAPSCPCSWLCPPAGPEDDDSQIESLLNQISEGRHAGDRREAMERLKELLADNPQVAPLPRLQAWLGPPCTALLPCAIQAVVCDSGAEQASHPPPAAFDRLDCAALQGQQAMGSMGLPVLTAVLQVRTKRLCMCTWCSQTLHCTCRPDLGPSLASTGVPRSST
jgi:hypothetical protein